MNSNNYILFLPYDIIELIIPYLEIDDLDSLVHSFQILKFEKNKNDPFQVLRPEKDELIRLKKGLNWFKILSYHFGKIIYEDVTYEVYHYFLIIEQVKWMLNFKFFNWSIEEIYDQYKMKDIYNLYNLYLPRERLMNMFPKEFVYYLIEDIDSIKSLNLSRYKLKSIPSEISSLRNLKELYLNNNQITLIPREIGQLRSKIAA